MALSHQPLAASSAATPTRCGSFRREANLAKVAEDLGCLGIRVERPADIRPALEKALAANRPAVVEVLSDVNAMAARAWIPTS